MKNEETLRFRRWLNNDDNGGSAFVKVYVKEADWTKHDETEEHGFEAELVLGDCTRTITLDFGAYKDDDDGKAIENIRAKVARLRRAVKQFTDAVLEQCNRIENEG